MKRRILLYTEGRGRKVAAGDKASTIRPRAGCKAGDTLEHREWAGLPYRSKQRKLCTSVCSRVRTVRITPVGVSIEGEQLGVEPLRILAQREGFEDVAAMLLWFAKSYKTADFRGELIEWEAGTLVLGEGAEGS